MNLYAKVGRVMGIVIRKYSNNDEGNGTLERFKKKSFYWYKKVIETNGQDLSSDNLEIQEPTAVAQ